MNLTEICNRESGVSFSTTPPPYRLFSALCNFDERVASKCITFHSTTSHTTPAFTEFGEAGSYFMQKMKATPYCCIVELQVAVSLLA